MDAKQKPLSFTIIGSLIAFVLQVVLAPSIAILDVVPNFILVFVVLNAMNASQARSSITGFILGLLYDFISQAALGTMAFVLTIIGFVVSATTTDQFSGTWVIRALYLLLASFFGELLHAVFLSVLGIDKNFLLSLGMRVVPVSLYSALFGLIIFPLMGRSAKKRDAGHFRGRFN